MGLVSPNIINRIISIAVVSSTVTRDDVIYDIILRLFGGTILRYSSADSAVHLYVTIAVVSWIRWKRRSLEIRGLRIDFDR